MSASMIGFAADTRSVQGQATLDKVKQDFPNKDFLAGIKAAQESKMRYIVAAGRLDRAADGVFMALALDEINAILGVAAANRRMTKAGAAATHWIVAGAADFQLKVQAVLKEEA